MAQIERQWQIAIPSQTSFGIIQADAANDLTAPA
jgi:hypothetical protein